MNVDAPTRTDSPMPKIPMTAGEQLELARQAGHTLHARDRRVNGHLKYEVWCSCGWRAEGKRSRKKAHAGMAMHLGKVLADSIAARQQ